jgi:Protein of unknown function (DUF1553)/Protein of unknown function (DUF1549)
MNIVNSRQKKNWLLTGTILVGSAMVLAGILAKNRVPKPRSLESLKADQATVDKVAQEIDVVFAERWKAAGIAPARPAENLTVIRRLSQGLTGTIPSIEEIRQLERVSSENQVEWWIARLLEDRRMSDHLAERFARAYVGVEDGPFIVFRRHRFVSWLSDQFIVNRPYDEIAREIVASTGLWTDTPETNFVSVTSDPNKDGALDPIKLAAKTSRSLLAMRIDCLECHDDFLGTIQLGEPDDVRGGEQIDFHHLAAFFGQVQNSLAGIQDSKQDKPYEFRLLEDTEPSKIPPAVPYLEKLLPAEGTLRERLAKWITHPENQPFARATVNRLWAVMFGKPIIEPIDDIPWGQELPRELEILADDFIANNFDMHRTIRIIAATRAFKLESQYDGEVTMEHEKLMAVFPIIRLRPEQMAQALLQATSLVTIDYSAGILNRLESFGRQNDFIQRFGDFGKDEFTARGETVTQRLLLLNGDLIRERINGNLLAPNKIAAVSPDEKKMAEVAFLACFTRYPTSEELNHFLTRFNDSEGKPKNEIVLDLFWAMFNSAEFGWSH